MYRLRKTKRFIKSYKKISLSGQWNNKIQKDLDKTIDLLLLDKQLPIKFRDHQLNGILSDYRECHIRGDLLLVYTILKDEIVLILVDIGSHSYLSL